jgi:glutamate formiminotransferase/formiminotetrahydrofolate cyclodeaminase
MVDAAFAAIRVARDRIDLTQHAGVHPRIGAADVVPFIPLEGATMDDCVALARALGERVGRELAIPVYLYERAATRPERRNLENVRRGGFEGLQHAITHDSARTPDYGPSHLHPTAGAVAIGARPFLVAFNVYIGTADQLPIAKAIAKAIRTSSGGLPAVKALGLEVDGQAQVSMNLTDIDQTPLSTVYEAVRTEAVIRGALVTWSEIIGLVPERVVAEAAGKYLRLRQPVEAHLLERRLLEVRGAAQDLHSYVESVASAVPTPGGGSVAAVTAALSAALTRMVAQLTLKRAKFSAVHTDMARVVTESTQLSRDLEMLAARDAEAYAKVMHAYALPHANPVETQERAAHIQLALWHAAEVPAETARACVRVAELAELVARLGTPNAITDAGTAAVLADAACRAASYNVRVNAKALPQSPDVTALVTTTQSSVETTRHIAETVAACVERTLVN